MTGFYAGKKIRPIFFWSSVILILELLSFLAWRFTFLAYIFLAIIFCGLILAYQRDDKNLLLLPLLELFWGSMGRSLQVGFFSLRWLVFVTTVLYFLWQQRFHIKQLKVWSHRAVSKIFWLYLVVVSFSSALGFFYGHPLRNIFFDANAYLFIFYLPIWYQYFDQSSLIKIRQILLAAAAVIALKTLLVFFYFVQLDSNSIILYKWLRDTRAGEMTPLDNGFFRIFFQAQVYLLLAWLIVFYQILKDKLVAKYFVYLVLLFSAIYISLSRSYWLGLAITLIILFFASRQYFTFIKYFILIFITAIFLVLLLFNLPQHHTWNLLANRTVSSQEAAISSRTQLWPIMIDSITKHPIVGRGFGQELSFYSNDPRIKNANNPSGLTTTYAFEWGWLDFMVKGGLLLPLFFVYWLFYIFRGTYGIIKSKPQFWPFLGFLVALPIIHVFSPYLNHPLGLGWLMLQTIIISKDA